MFNLPQRGGARIGGIGHPAANALSQSYRDQTMANQQRAQQQLNQQEMVNNQLTAQQRARDTQTGLMADPNNPRSTNGMEMEISNQQPQQPRSGIALSNGVYPDLTQMAQQFATAQSQLAPPPSLPRTPPPVVPSTKGAFAHAKDVSGRTGNKALEALRNSMTARGISDSGLAAVGEAEVLGNVARQQSDAEYQAANIDNSRQWEANQLAYQGNMRHDEMEYQHAMNQRNQSLQALFEMFNRLY